MQGPSPLSGIIVPADPPTASPTNGSLLRALLVALPATLLALLLSSLPFASAAAATGSAAAAESYEQRAVEETNRYRTNHHLRTMGTDRCLGRFAQRQANRMANQQRMFHQDLIPIMGKCGLSRVGENVAYGYSSGRTVVSKGWMKSPQHRANILTRAFEIVAVGAARDTSGRWWTAQVLGSR